MSQADYDQFLPPAGPIEWTTPEDCEFQNHREPFLHESTPQGILDRIEWDLPTQRYPDLIKEHPLGKAFANATIERAQELDWEMFGNNPRFVTSVCGHVQALHPQIPVVRATFNMNVYQGDWTNPETGDRLRIVKAYRLEARYIFISTRSGFVNVEPLGPILIEPLGSFCDRDDIIVQDQSQPACNIPGN